MEPLNRLKYFTGETWRLGIPKPHSRRGLQHTVHFSYRLQPERGDVATCTSSGKDKNSLGLSRRASLIS